MRIKRNTIYFIIFIFAVMLFGCKSDDSKEVETEKLPDYFGPELYNISCMVYDEKDEEVTQYINLMTKIEIPEALETEIESTGGRFDYSIAAKKGDYKLDDYTLYEIEIVFKNIEFTDKVININEISIYDENKQSIIVGMKPKKFEIQYLDGNYDNEDLIFSSIPLSLPRSMSDLTYELDADANLTINEIKLSNSDFVITNADDCRNIEMKKNQNTELVTALFKVKEDELSEYTQYISSIIFYYMVEDMEYVKMTPVTQVIYNPTLKYDDNLAEYYNEVILKSN
ncbi:MAG: hypothetical protein K2M73_03955 [Lachnospiraceae bacterium]|nr:hypothetical protein [Lachnospiraceae bacterium]